MKSHHQTGKLVDFLIPLTTQNCWQRDKAPSMPSWSPSRTNNSLLLSGLDPWLSQRWDDDAPSIRVHATAVQCCVPKEAGINSSGLQRLATRFRTTANGTSILCYCRDFRLSSRKRVGASRFLSRPRQPPPPGCIRGTPRTTYRYS